MSVEPITIVRVDENATRRLEGDFFDVSLILSSEPPTGWVGIFNAKWKMHLYMLKRNALASGSRIRIQCVLSELDEHILELRKIINEANQEFLTTMAKIDIQKQAELQRNEADRNDISALNKKLFGP